MRSRRSFLAGAAGLGLAAPTFAPNALARLMAANKAAGQASPLDLAQDEDYWSDIQRAFDVDRTLINLNNGGCCPTPTHVLEQMIRDLKFTNEAPGAPHVARPRAADRDGAPRAGARVRLRPGGDGDHAQRLRGDRDPDLRHRPGAGRRGHRHRPELPAHAHQLGPARAARRDRGQADLVRRAAAVAGPLRRAIEAAITPRTRVIEFPHITNLSGQILPVREIGRPGRERGHRGVRRRRARLRPLPVHARRPGLRLLRHEPAQVAARADRHGLPLRPQGEAEEDLAADGGADATLDEDIRKYEEIGTHPAANHNAIEVALAFHRGIGAERKAARLRFLRDRWARRLPGGDPSG